MGDFDKDRRHEDKELKAQLAELRADFSELREDFSGLQSNLEKVMTKQDAQTAATSALVEAWNTGTGVVKFVKWLAGLVGAVGVILAIFHADTDAMIKSIFK